VNATTPADYLPFIDWLKALAIVAVVVTHALTLPTVTFLYPTAIDVRLHFAVQFCVPAFLFASGVLHGRGGPAATGPVGRQLARILGPYVIASGIAQITGLSGAKTGWDVVVQLATGASLSIYYYVFLLVVCLLLTWGIEQIHPRASEVALVALAVYAIVTTIVPWPVESFFWIIRDPLHFWGYYLAGAVAWRHRGTLARLATGQPAVVAAACVMAIAIYVAVGPGVYYRAASAGLLRGMYTLGIVGAVALTLGHRIPPPAVRFLSRSSYAIYLYHFFFEALLTSPTLHWPAAARIGTRVAAGLAGALLVCLAGTRLLRTRARPLLGV